MKDTEMTVANFDEFKTKALANGASEALVREYASNVVIDTHSHPFDADAVVTQGEMWLTCGDETRHLLPGDTFQLASGTPHSERYGADGAVYWVARREPA
jgi:quercetin dioxygenase-like cupin family protein